MGGYLFAFLPKENPICKAVGTIPITATTSRIVIGITPFCKKHWRVACPPKRANRLPLVVPMNDSNIILNIKIVVRIQLLSLSYDDESFFFVI